jgi:hypothetical protein
MLGRIDCGACRRGLCWQAAVFALHWCGPCRRRGAATASELRKDLWSRLGSNWRMPTMTCTAVAVQQTVDGTQLPRARQPGTLRNVVHVPRQIRQERPNAHRRATPNPGAGHHHRPNPLWGTSPTRPTREVLRNQALLARPVLVVRGSSKAQWKASWLLDLCAVAVSQHAGSARSAPSNTA